MIAAGSLVLKDIPPHSIVAGIPAKVVGYVEEQDPSLTMKHDATKDICLRDAAADSKDGRSRDGKTVIDKAGIGLCCTLTYQSYWISIYDGLITIGNGQHPFQNLVFEIPIVVRVDHEGSEVNEDDRDEFGDGCEVLDKWGLE
ncbi:hypothetical protein IFM89_018995 [Coptis chinensis]|uniref:Serine O-acetyltransferase n=1 Tax=Coptis chinensis TaxID=261450 RepID=A0A835I4C2_9MAGN|nr:hypothetical protein IFM89_018995 [Coptis chinensis]